MGYSKHRPDHHKGNRYALFLSEHSAEQVAKAEPLRNPSQGRNWREFVYEDFLPEELIVDIVDKKTGERVFSAWLGEMSTSGERGENKQIEKLPSYLFDSAFWILDFLVSRYGPGLSRYTRTK